MLTIKRAREILGDKAESLSDTKLTQIIKDLDEFASIFIKIYLDMTPEKRKNLHEKSKNKHS